MEDSRFSLSKLPRFEEAESLSEEEDVNERESLQGANPDSGEEEDEEEEDEEEEDEEGVDEERDEDDDDYNDNQDDEQRKDKVEQGTKEVQEKPPKKKLTPLSPEELRAHNEREKMK